MSDDEVLLVDHDEPTNYQKAVLDLESDKWLRAMNAEMPFMYD